MMPPAGMPRPDAADAERLRQLSRDVNRSRRGGQSTPGPDGASSPESRRVRQRDSRSARARDRCHRAAAARRREQRLRQHRRRADRVAVADGAVSVGVLEYQPDGGRQRAASRRARSPIASGRTSRRISTSTGCRRARAAGCWSSTRSRVDGEYIIKLRLWRNTFDLMRGMEDPHDIEIAMDGARLTIVTVGRTRRLRHDGREPGNVRRGPGSDADRAAAGEGGHAHASGRRRS